MLKKLTLGLIVLLCMPTWANVQLGDLKLPNVDWKDTYWPDKFTIKTIVDSKLNAVPTRDPQTPIGFRLIIDDALYYIQPALFMLKSRPDEVCTFDLDNYRSYRCVEGQPHVDGCHLMFFDAQGKWVGLYTMQIKERFPHFCNAMPAIGIANKANNELLVTMQYFIPEALQGLPVTPTGGGWFRMTSLFRVKAVNGKIEVEQDDTCLGNPNRIDNIPDARKRLRQCGAVK
ncbi:hypothetical protein B9Z44_04335 [Limnohabitans curvus]|uniref:Uncharacterized protein n=1 Tax=Limnohabitans curvus TaxID=323423 RepID=A0A315FZT5_9BURK|nr:hypothetical protein [Limnohabitans curvus]PUE58887.1 hypothetical protein B9Z44_04335 [Limnohabitans curvus]